VSSAVFDRFRRFSSTESLEPVPRIFAVVWVDILPGHIADRLVRIIPQNVSNGRTLVLKSAVGIEDGKAVVGFLDECSESLLLLLFLGGIVK
jgi:hypothetical protein